MEERNKEIRAIVLDAKRKYSTAMARHTMARALGSPELEELTNQYESCREETIALALDIMLAGVEVARMDRIAHIVGQQLDYEEMENKIQFLDETSQTAVRGLVWLNTGSKDDVVIGGEETASTLLASSGISAMAFALNCTPGPEGQDTTTRLAGQLKTLAGMLAASICGLLSEDTDDESEIEIRYKKAKTHILNGILATLEMLQIRKAGEHN